MTKAFHSTIQTSYNLLLSLLSLNFILFYPYFGIKIPSQSYKFKKKNENNVTTKSEKKLKKSMTTKEQTSRTTLDLILALTRYVGSIILRLGTTKKESLENLHHKKLGQPKMEVQKIFILQKKRVDSESCKS